MIENLDAKKNWDACLVIIDAVGHVPQSRFGKYLVADTLMKSFEPNYMGRRVSIAQMAEIKPDVSACADRINDIHRLFDVPYRVNEAQALTVVMHFALAGLGEIAEWTKYYSNSGGIDQPYKVEGLFVYGNLSPHRGGPKFENVEAAIALEDYLREHPGVREPVAKSIRRDAVYYRNKSSFYQKKALNQLKIQEQVFGQYND